jgi:hypothetical protein
MRKRAHAVLLAGASAALASISCQWLVGLTEPQPGTVRAPQDAGARDPCNHALPPPAPAVDDDASADSQRNYWIAVESVYFPALQPDAGPFVGLDLDQSCTCQHDLYDGGPTCKTPAQNDVACDADGGIDDAVGRLLATYQPLVPGLDLADNVNREIRSGQRTFMLYVGGYNGLPNDKRITVAIVRSSGIYTNLGCDGTPRDAGPPQGPPEGVTPPGPRYFPVWDGCDRWWPSVGLVTGQYPNRAPIASVDGWVDDSVFVVHFDDVSIDVFGNAVTFQGATAIGRFSRDGSGLRAEGIITGRVAFAELVASLARTSSELTPGQETPLCQLPQWGAVAGSLCAGRDIMLDPNGDRSGQVCDAMSVSLGFTARSAQIADGEFNNEVAGLDCPDASIACTAP